MTEPQPLSVLRENSWSDVPSSPGVYWWYFAPTELDRLRVSELCDVDQLRLRVAPDGKVCLYHGMANNLAERIEWHAAQKLSLKCLQSGFLSTFRFTLLALNDFDYSRVDSNRRLLRQPFGKLASGQLPRRSRVAGAQRTSGHIPLPAQHSGEQAA